MDTSLEYLNMCYAASDYIGNHEVRFDVKFNAHLTNLVITHKNADVWMPRQDQLQEIIKDKGRGLAYTPMLFINLANAFLHMYYDEYKSLPDTMEKMWLMILMRENYNRCWKPEYNGWYDVK